MYLYAIHGCLYGQSHANWMANYLWYIQGGIELSQGNI